MVMRAEMQSVAERKAAYSADCAKPGMNLFPFCWLGWEGGIQRGVRCMCLVGFKHGICSVQLEVHFHFLGMILVVRFNLFLPISCFMYYLLKKKTGNL